MYENQLQETGELETINDEDIVNDSDGYSEVDKEIDLELYELGLDEKAGKTEPKKEVTMTFRLMFAIILSIIFMVTTPFTARSINLQLYWWAPIIAGFVGALLGAYIGSILDAFNFLLPSKR